MWKQPFPFSLVVFVCYSDIEWHISSWAPFSLCGKCPVWHRQQMMGLKLLLFYNNNNYNKIRIQNEIFSFIQRFFFSFVFARCHRLICIVKKFLMIYLSIFNQIKLNEILSVKWQLSAYLIWKRLTIKVYFPINKFIDIWTPNAI